MSMITKFGAAIVIAMSASAANSATTIDFTGSNPNDFNVRLFNSGYTEDGFIIDSQDTNGVNAGTGTGTGDGIGIYGSGADRYRGPTEAMIGSNLIALISLRKDDGGLFDVVSFDVATANDTSLMADPDNPDDGMVDILWTGTFADDSTATHSFQGTIGGFQTVNFGTKFENVKSLTWITTDFTKTAQYDNIVVDFDQVSTPPITPGVPEPSTWLMMLAGFAVTGFSLKRREAYKAA